MSSTSSTPRGGSVRTKLVVNTILALSFLLISAPLLTRVAIHEWLSIAFVAVVLAHVVLSWNWVVAVTRRFFAQVRGPVRFNYVWDFLLYFCFIVAMVSGLAVSEQALPALGIPFERDRFWSMAHKVSGEGMMIMAGVHLAMHWDWIVAAVGRLLTGRLAPSGRGNANASWWIMPTVVMSVAGLVLTGITYVGGTSSMADRLRARGGQAQAERTASRERDRDRPPVDSAARAARREEMLNRRREREAGQGAPTAAPAPAEASADAPAPPAAEGQAARRPRAEPREAPPRLSLAVRAWRSAEEIGVLMGTPFLITLAGLMLIKRARTSRAQPAIDPLDESGE